MSLTRTLTLLVRHLADNQSMGQFPETLSETLELPLANGATFKIEPRLRTYSVADHHELQCFTKEGAIRLGTAHRDNYLLLDDEQMKPSCASPNKVNWFNSNARHLVRLR